MNEIFNNGSRFSRWYNGIFTSIDNFDRRLFDLFLVATDDDRDRLVAAFPEKFLPLIKEREQ